jgi:hypothetical protein
MSDADTVRTRAMIDDANERVLRRLPAAEPANPAP